MPRNKILRCLTYGLLAIALYIIGWLGFNFVGAGVADNEAAVPFATEILGIDGPLKENGDIDFTQLANDKASAGVTFENNAAIPIFSNVDSNYLSKYHDDVIKVLGFQRPQPGKAGMYRGASAWATHKNKGFESGGQGSRRRGRGPSRQSQIDDFTTRLRHATDHLWQDADHPEIAEWLDEMAQPLDKIALGCKRQHFYIPLLELPNSSNPFEENSGYFSDVFRDLKTGYQVRANRNFAKGDFEGWLADLETINQLGNLAKSNNFAIGAQLVSNSFHQSANEMAENIIYGEDLDDDQLLRIMKVFTGTKNKNSLANSIRFGERSRALRHLNSIARHGAGAYGNNTNPIWHRKLLLDCADYNTVFRIVNEDFERIANYVEDKQANWLKNAWQLDADMEKRGYQQGPWNEAAAILLGRKAKGKFLGDQFSLLLAPALWHVVKSILETDTQKKMLLLAIALKRFKLHQQAYPDTLDSLVPDYLAQIPRDSYNAAAFVYQKQDGIYTLYSLGTNGQDDGGKIGDLAHKPLDMLFTPIDSMTWEEFQENERLIERQTKWDRASPSDQRAMGPRPTN